MPLAAGRRCGMHDARLSGSDLCAGHRDAAGALNGAAELSPARQPTRFALAARFRVF